MESFNGRLRDKLLSSEIFDTLAEARYLIDRWRLVYHHRRNQRVLGKVTPAVFAATCQALPPLRLAAAPPGMQGATTMHQHLHGVDRRERPRRYNAVRPLSASGTLTPGEFAELGQRKPGR